MADTRYLIIGNGVAGITAAQEIRCIDPEGRLVIVGDEGEPYYYRASMSEWMSGETTDEMLPGRVPRFYDDLRIEQMVGHVESVDPAAKRATLLSGHKITYERLLLASGARANRFPVPGLDEVLVFRDLVDVRTIKERVGCCGRTLIVGGGILGLELAGALKKMGMESIAIAHRHEYVGAPLLDARAADWLQRRIRADGVELFLDDTIDHVTSMSSEPTPGGGTAHLKSGRAWPFDLLVQAVGVRPTYPDVPDLEVGRGIRIDTHCRTNLTDVYAAGDCTETRIPGSDNWRPTRIWLHGAWQGRTAGHAMAEREATLPEKPFFNASVIYTINYTYVGEPHGAEGTTHVWENGDAYRAVRTVDSHLAGALLLGERRGSLALMEAIGQPLGDRTDGLAHPQFPFNDLTGKNWDMLFY